MKNMGQPKEITSHSSGDPYLFGDTDLAVQRLRLLADLFARSSKARLEQEVMRPPSRVVDLGYGPGHTTALLSDRFPSAEIVGLDNSASFVSRARQEETERIAFHLHDVTTAPFPVGHGNLLYCRFVLSHISDPEATVETWATQLRPRGLLLAEETQSIHTADSVFRTYLEIVEAMLVDQGCNLYAGETLETMTVPAVLMQRCSNLAVVRVPTPTNARLYLMNMKTWKDTDFVKSAYPSELIAQLEGDLEYLAGAARDTGKVEYRIRQGVFERV